MKRKTIFLITSLLVFSAGLMAQLPQAFKYQAVLRDNTGETMPNHNVGLRISILEGPSGSTTLYTETFSKTTNDFGLFTIEIGTGTTGDDFSAINWANGQSKWVKVEIDTTGGSAYMEMGTSQLLSVPFAMFAKSAGGDSQWKAGTNGDRKSTRLNSSHYS